MAPVEVTTVRATTAAVFQAVTEPELIPQWMEEVYWIRYENGVRPEEPVGARFRQRVREGLVPRVFEGEVLVYDLDRRFKVRFGDQRLEMVVEYVLEELGEDCRVTYQLELNKKSLFLRLAAGLVDGVSAQVARRHMVALKRFVESG